MNQSASPTRWPRLRRSARGGALVLLLAVVACSHPPTAGTPPADTRPAVKSGYDKPPQHVLDVLHAPRPAVPQISPTRATILLVSWVQYPPIAQVAEPFLKLAGVRVEPRTRRKHDTRYGYGVAQCAHTLALVDVATGTERPVALPAGGCTDGFTWSADGTRFALRNTAQDAVELWIGDVASAALRRLDGVRLNPMLDSSHGWMPDQQTLLVKLVPRYPGPPPAGSVLTTGPGIQETDGKSGESSTYEKRDALTSKHDEALFEYYATSQLALVDATSGAIKPVGKAAVITDIEPSPDGEHILVNALRKPYSYVTTYENFARDVEVWDRNGKALGLASLPVADRVPIHGVPTGPREHAWRSTAPATLVWVEALDGGDWNVKVPARDKVMTQRAPFTAPPAELLRTEQRFTSFHWGEQRGLALMGDYDDNRHWLRTFALDVDDPQAKPKLLFDMSSEERYRDPGQPVYRQLRNGQWVMQQDGSRIYLRGEGASPQGNRPFVDRLDVTTGATERLFRSGSTGHESFIGFTGPGDRTFFTWRQAPADPPNVMLRTLGEPLAGAPAGEATIASTMRQVTHIPDPTPVVRNIKKRLVRYQRKDGVELSFTLYTPPGYVEGTRIPAVLYAYPLDYASAAVAGQVSGSEQLYTRLFDYRLLLLSGYAIVDNAAFPIVGEPARAYDTYLEQLIDNARAAVDKAVELGVVDRDRIGVTGHSHGALMAANLVAHTDLFRAAIATSGAYNKVLTPFGFQSERRTLWKARDVYIQASPLFFADRIKLPLLIIHGEDDANPGTTPLQSVKLYEAIRGNGGTARLVMLPHEPHWYAAMESNEQLAYEELRWFDRYVKDAPPRASKPAAAR